MNIEKELNAIKTTLTAIDHKLSMSVYEAVGIPQKEAIELIQCVEKIRQERDEWVEIDKTHPDFIGDVNFPKDNANYSVKPEVVDGKPIIRITDAPERIGNHMHVNGKDYLFIKDEDNQSTCNCCHICNDCPFEDLDCHEKIGYWIETEGLTITDPLAKLRPYVTYKTDSGVDILYGVRDDKAIVWDRSSESLERPPVYAYTLSTVAELKAAGITE